MSTNPATAVNANGKRRGPVQILLRIALVLAIVWALASVVVYAEMRKPPETFARFMTHVPGPVAFLALPFETMWTHARAGMLGIGDSAPDFDLLKLDKTSRVQLSALNAKGPVVLVFGSYT